MPSRSNFFRTTDVTGAVELPASLEMVLPGEDAVIGIRLKKPVAMDTELRFAIREGGLTVGSGVVKRIVR